MLPPSKKVAEQELPCSATFFESMTDMIAPISTTTIMKCCDNEMLRQCSNFFSNRLKFENSCESAGFPS